MNYLKKISNNTEDVNIPDEFPEDSSIDWEEHLSQKIDLDDQDLDTEERHFGNWINDLPIIHKFLFEQGAHADLGMDHNSKYVKDLIHNLIPEKIGAGSSRIVYKYKDNDNVVVKFSRAQNGSNQNKFEFDMQQAYSGLFPKVYAHGKGAFKLDFDWMVVEACTPINSDKGVDEFFPILKSIWDNLSGPKSLSAFSLFISMCVYEKTYKSYVKKLNIAKDNGIEDEKKWFEQLLNKLKLYNNFNTACVNNNIEPEVLSARFLKDPLARKIYYLNIRSPIYIEDLSAGNVGTNSKGQFVLLDIAD